MAVIGSRERKVGIVAAACVGLLVADRVVINPAVAAWRDRSERIEELTVEVARAEALLDQADSWSERHTRMVSSSLPSNLSEAENTVLRSINAWAQSARLDIGTVRPRWRQSRDEPTVLELRVSGSGSLRSVVAFLRSVESGDLPFRNVSLELTGREEGRRIGFEVELSGLVNEKSSATGEESAT